MTPGHLIASPLGDIVMRIEDECVTGLFFVGQKYFPSISIATGDRPASPVARKTQEQIAEYFAGARTTFSVPRHLRGTGFQRRVWKELLSIPFGTLVSYGELTQRIGLPVSAARAVGGAVGRNPVSIMVPCHRIVGATGSLTGYAGGIDRKRALLALEGAGRACGRHDSAQHTLAL
ncbi:methylated-DNA--[protein]-cysteine S-methyltransferase [Burkholderia sp. PU8-34]